MLSKLKPRRTLIFGAMRFRGQAGPFLLQSSPRVDPRGERCAVARVSLLHQGVPQAQRPGAPHTHPHPREALQVPTVLPGLRREEHADGPRQNAHGHQGVQVPLLHEELLHLGKPQGAHSPAHRYGGTSRRRWFTAGSAVTAEPVEHSLLFILTSVTVTFCGLGTRYTLLNKVHVTLVLTAPMA